MEAKNQDESDKKSKNQDNAKPEPHVSRRTFLFTVGGFATAVGFLGAGALSSGYADLTTTSQIERLSRELDEVKTSRDSIVKIYSEKKIASGGGLLELTMPNAEKQPKVPVRLMFSFDPNMVLLHVDGNREPFVLQTHSLGDLVVDTNSFVLTFSADLPSVTFSVTDDGRPMAQLRGTGGCGVSATSSETKIGGQSLKEDVNFEMTVVDGAGVADEVSIRFLIHDKLSPTLFSVFGEEEIFTGKIIGGRITIKEISRLPI